MKEKYRKFITRKTARIIHDELGELFTKQDLIDITGGLESQLEKCNTSLGLAENENEGLKVQMRALQDAINELQASTPPPSRL